MPTLPVVFQFDQSAVRVVTGDAGEPWFNANDVCAILEYGNARQALDSHVDSEDVQKLDTLGSAGGVQLANHINESGLYALILGSTKPEAKRFKRWVTSEVLPSIRKTGSYSTGPAHDPRLDLLPTLVGNGLLTPPTAERATLAILGLDPVLASGPRPAPTAQPVQTSPHLVTTARGILSAFLAGPMMDGLPVSSAIAAALGGSSAAVDSLALHGLRVKGDQLWFGTGIMRLRFMADAIGVGRDLRKHLLALPGAVRVQTQRFGGVNSKVVAIPLSLVGELSPCDGVF